MLLYQNLLLDHSPADEGAAGEMDVLIWGFKLDNQLVQIATELNVAVDKPLDDVLQLPKRMSTPL